MRSSHALILAAFAVRALASGQIAAQAASCTGLCLQQVSCTGNATTSITGNVYAPNGTDPLPNVTVYIPNAPVAAFTPGVSCPVVGAPPSGSPLVGTTSAVDGSFELDNVPVGTNIPLVIVSGRWRRQLVIPTTTACTNTALPASFAVFPQNQSQGDIPKIAIATGAVDQVECILRKVGINDSEFTDPSGSGRINLYLGSGGPGSGIDSATPTQATLMENAANLNAYDVLMLPCQGTPDNNYVAGSLGTQELANFVSFANAGGRVYSSHYSYAWMVNNPPFNTVVNWDVGQGDPPNGTATVNTSFTAGETLAQWLELTGATTTLGQMPITTLRDDFNGVVAPTQAWLTLNDPPNNPVQQFVFNTPIAPAGTTVNQCGRVLYNEYHVEAGTSSPSQSFPTECSSTASSPLTPQEKLLEYMLFELTDEGGQPSLSPTSAAFGNQAVSFSSAPQAFTWTNNSSFASQVTSATTTNPDFSVASNNCTTVAAASSCTINVVYTPSVLGAETATLNVLSAGNTLSASLTGTGVPGLSFSTASLTYGSQDVGFSTSQSVVVTNAAPQAIPLPQLLITGDYAVTNGCGAAVPGLGTCTLTVTFTPSITGTRTGTLSVNSTALVYSGLTVALTGNGVDFTLALNSTSGSVVAGDGVTPIATLTPLAGYAAAVTLSCSDSASGSACTPATTSVTLSATLTSNIAITTTSQYSVIGYRGLGTGRFLWLAGIGTGLLLSIARRRATPLVRSMLIALVLTAAALSASGCSGKLPTQNAVYTAPGSYNVTIKATDGFLTHYVNYALTVNAK